jgi:hypothetical protein
MQPVDDVFTEPLNTPGPGPLLDLWAKIGLRLDTLTAQLEAQLEQDARLWEQIRFVPGLPLAQIPQASLPAALTTTVKAGWTMAVQRVSATGFASGTDSLSLYRGAIPQDAVPQNFLNVLTQAAPAWHPGGKGLLLKPSQALVVGGGTAAATYTVNLDGILISDDLLPRYLI